MQTDLSEVRPIKFNLAAADCHVLVKTRLDAINYLTYLNELSRVTSRLRDSLQPPYFSHVSSTGVKNWSFTFIRCWVLFEKYVNISGRSPSGSVSSFGSVASTNSVAIARAKAAEEERMRARANAINSKGRLRL